MPLYPLIFKPRFVEKIWGGRKLQTVLGKTLSSSKPTGESWELFDFPPGVVESSDQWVSSEIADGPLAGRSLHWAVGEFGADLLGGASLSGSAGQFPVLIKFLDAREDLSVQVHPDAAYASAHPEAHLKTEAWYVLQSDPGSRLLMGIEPGTSRTQFEQAIRQGAVEQFIRNVPANESDCFYLPSGTVHALGAGLLVAEVQTPSDTTFRVYDFNRVDPGTGKQRALHIEQALACIDFAGATSAATPTPQPRLVASPYFSIDRFELPRDGRRSLAEGEARVLIVTREALDITWQNAPAPVRAVRGQVVLIPASLTNAQVAGNLGVCEWLEVTFPV